MSRIRRSARALTTVAAAALVVGTMFPAFAASSPAVSGDSSKSINVAVTSKEQRPVGAVASKVQGEDPSIELNVDTTSDDAQVSLISYTFTGGAPAKFAFGNRFTLSNEQAPFRLEAVAVFLAKRSDDGTGWQAGEPIGIEIFVDAASTGDMSKAINVFSAETTVQTEDSFNVYGLQTPIVVQQGDIYIVFVDLTTDDEATQLPVVLPENGGSTDPRAWAATSIGSSNQGSAFFMANELPLGDGQLEGNFVIRGLGDPKEASDLVTGGGETIDDSIPVPQDINALGSGTVTVGWSAVTLPPPPPPTPVAETEPNDSPATAQAIGTNVRVTGTANSGQSGAPGGPGDDDVEDWFSITITQATSITIDLDPSGTDFDLMLYPSGGPFNFDDALATSAGPPGEEHIELDILPAGTYLIAVSAFDPDVPSNTNYTLDVVAAPKVSRYNVYCGPSADFNISAATFIGSVPGDQTSITIRESAPGAYYRVTAVAGASQSPQSDSATGEPCEGGPTFTSVKVKRNGPGSITLKGGTGDLTGVQILINGVGFTKAPKVKASKHQVKQKGPLTNGLTVGEACPVGCTITIRTAAGCSTVVAP